jgi:GTP diphosphokinase / guanosine-3',5'-bis(diphosphate) 3'-diphosphatase
MPERFGERKLIIFGPDNPVPQDWKSMQALIGGFDPQSQYDIELAFQISQAAHDGQVRVSGEPFFTHPLRATYYLLAAGCRHRHHIVACLLHDVPEDTKHLEQQGGDFYKIGSYLRPYDTGEIDSFERLAQLFGRGTANLIETVTKPKGISDKAELAAKYRQQMLTGHPGAGIIKMPDTLDNLLTLGFLPTEKRMRKIREYENSDPVFTRALNVPGNRSEVSSL